MSIDKEVIASDSLLDRLSEVTGYTFTGESTEGEYSVVLEVEQMTATALEVLNNGLPIEVWASIMLNWDQRNQVVSFVYLDNGEGRFYRVCKLIPFQQIVPVQVAQ